MIKISILYPNTSGSRFDMVYYVEKHMPMSIRLLSAHPGFKGVSVEKGPVARHLAPNLRTPPCAISCLSHLKRSWRRLHRMPQHYKGTFRTTPM